VKVAPSFHVSTFGLSPDLQRVHPAFGRIKRGNLSRHQLFGVLETYRRIEIEDGPSASRIEIHSDQERLIVRVSEHQLLLGVEGALLAQLVPHAAEEIVTRLEQPPAPAYVRPLPPPAEPLWRGGVALLLLLAGVALMVHALKPVLAPERERRPEDITLVTDAAYARKQQRALAGLFATGQQNGDRHLTISAGGYILFAEIGPRNALNSRTDTFEIGRRDQRTYLVTFRNGVVAILDSNTLVHDDDTYRRQQ
jgi:hypothetical protein